MEENELRRRLQEAASRAHPAPDAVERFNRRFAGARRARIAVRSGVTGVGALVITLLVVTLLPGGSPKPVTGSFVAGSAEPSASFSPPPSGGPSPKPSAEAKSTTPSAPAPGLPAIRPTDTGSPVVSGDGSVVAFEVADLKTHEQWIAVRTRGSDTYVRIDPPNGQDRESGADPSPVSLGIDGTHVVFMTRGRNSAWQLYERDIASGKDTLVSAAPNGDEANENALTNSIAQGAVASADCRYVTFASTATNLVTAATGGVQQVFVRDLVERRTEMVSVDDSGNPGNAASFTSTLSSDGRYVGFGSDATNLVTLDSNQTRDVFVRDVTGGHTTRASVDANGTEVREGARAGVILGSGRSVVFLSVAALAPGASDPRYCDPTGGDIYEKDLDSGAVSLRASCAQAAWVDVYASADGSAIAGVYGDLDPNVSVISAARQHQIPGYAASGCFTDDGRYLAYGRDDSQGGGVPALIYDVSADTTTPAARW